MSTLILSSPLEDLAGLGGVLSVFTIGSLGLDGFCHRMFARRCE